MGDHQGGPARGRGGTSSSPGAGSLRARWRNDRKGRAGQAGQRPCPGADRTRQRRLPAHRDPAAGALRPPSGRGRAARPHRDSAPGVAHRGSGGGGGDGGAATGRRQDIGGAAAGRGAAPSGESRRAPCTAHLRGRRDEPRGQGSGGSAGGRRADPGDGPSLRGDHRGGPAGGRERDPVGDGRTGRAVGARGACAAPDAGPGDGVGGAGGRPEARPERHPDRRRPRPS